MEKRAFALFFISLLILNIIAFSGSVYAEENPINTRLNLWLEAFKDPSKTSATGEMIKWLFLVLIIVLIYSALASANFPPNAGIRLFMAIVIGFLATMLITTSELLTALEGYKAMGISLIIFIPIIILAFFTYVVATKVSAGGIFAQRILWLVYGVFLMIKTGGALLGIWQYSRWASQMNSIPIIGPVIVKMQQWMYGGAPPGDPAVLVVLFIVSIAVIFTFVFNKKLIDFLILERRQAEMERQDDILKRSQGLRRAEADITRT